jgi:membrane protease YdiL (CAAX protease family)
MNQPAESPRSRRLLEAAAFVGVWIALGLCLHLGANAYLLTGIPLTLLFQIFVRKHPVRAIWVRDSPEFRLRRPGILYVIGFVIVPVVFLIEVLRVSHPPDRILLLCSVAACLSALPAAYAFQNFRRSTWRNLALCLATAGLIGAAIMTLGFLTTRPSTVHFTAALKTGVKWFLFYLPYSFVVEECSFRGLLDAHVHRPGDRHGFRTALYVSALWGVWHYPVVGHGHPLAFFPVILYQCLVGVPLSLFWRRSGNLGVPATVHAFLDAVRNALHFVPH